MKFGVSAVLAFAFCIAVSTQFYAQGKARIIIKSEKNGVESEEIREITIDTTQNLNDIFLNLGLLNDFGFLQEGQEFEINIDQFNRMGDDQNILFRINPWSNQPHRAEKQAYLGIRMKEEETQSGKKVSKNIVITEVTPGSSATSCGLLSGDVLLELDKNKIVSTDQVMRYIGSKSAGDILKIKVKRGKQKLQLTAVLGTKPGSNRNFNRQWQQEKRKEFGNEENKQQRPQNDQELQELREWMQRISPDGEGPLNLGEYGMPTGMVAYLGVSPMEAATSTTGALIKVNKGTCADAMGVEDGDIITTLNGEKIADFTALADKVRTMKPGDEVTLIVWRNGEEKTLTGKLGGRMVSSNNDFRIYRDYKGMDEEGDHLYNYEFDMNAKDLERHMEELLRNLDDRQLLLDEQRWQLEEGLDKFRSGKSTMKIRISIMDLEASDKQLLSEKAKPKVDLNNSLYFDEISFFPNPNLGLVNLKFKTSDQSNLKITIYDTNGNVIYLEERTDFAGEYDHAIDLSNQPNGSYILQILQGNKSYLKKIIKTE